MTLYIRFLTDAALLFMGGMMIWFANGLWKTHPVNRVFSLGPYLTEQGLALLLKNWMVVFSFGLTFVAMAMSRFFYKLHLLGWPDHARWISDVFAVTEVGFALWSAFCVTRIGCAIRDHNKGQIQ